MATQLFDLTGKIALVSGASRGIGEEIAMLFGEQGAHVIVSSRKIDDCNAVAESIRTAGGSAEAFALQNPQCMLPSQPSGDSESSGSQQP